MPLYRIADDQFDDVVPISLAEAGIRERDLQSLLKERADVFDADTLLLTEEFSDWADSSRRIDLLGLDRDGTLVVIELKRGAGEHMELQAVRYAAMVSDLTFERAVRAYSSGFGSDDLDEARDALLSHLGWDLPREEAFAAEVRIVLASETFDPEITTAVLWLNDSGLNIQCVEMTAYRGPAGGTLLDVRRIIPLPNADDYRVREKAKRAAVRAERAGLSDEQRHLQRFWQRVIDEGNARDPIPGLFAGKRPNYGGQLSRQAVVSGVPRGWLGFDLIRHEVRIGLTFGGGSESSNAAFDCLAEHREAVEAAFGEPLMWERRDANSSAWVGTTVPRDDVADASQWETFVPDLVSRFIRLEAALLPALESTDEGERAE